MNDTHTRLAASHTFKLDWVVFGSHPLVQVFVIRVDQSCHTKDGAVTQVVVVKFAILRIVEDERTTVRRREDGYGAVPRLGCHGLDWRRQPLPMNEVLRYDMIPMVLAALFGTCAHVCMFARVYVGGE